MLLRKLWALGRRTAFHISRRSRVAFRYTRAQKASQTILFCSILYPPIYLWHERQHTANKLAKPTNCLPKFRYEPLPIVDPEDSTNQTFRLLELRPGHDSEEIECALTESHLRDSVPYETISYRWSDDMTTITCNGTALSIPRSLAEALCALRYRDQPRLLWADAICIDQGNNAEKGSQVQLMRRIYSQAQGVLVWLGNAAGEGNSDISVSFPARLAIVFGLVTLRPPMDKHNGPYVRVRDVRKGTVYDLAPFSVEFYLQLIGLLRKPWFGRAWVVQEIAVSKKATVVWGSKQCEWNELIRALELMSKARFPLAFMPTLQHIAGIEEERKRHKKGPNTLLGLLLRHQRCLSTNPLDKVYAFCGLMGTSPSEFIDVPIFYENKVETLYSVYRDVATKILQHDRNLDILSHPPSPGHISPRTSDLPSWVPSWVPDWSRCTSKDMAHALGIGPLSLASKEMDSQPSPKPPFTATKDSVYTPSPSPSPNCLTLSGYAFDTITVIGPVFNGVQVPSTVMTLRGIVLSWLHTFQTFWQARDVLRAWGDIAHARSQTFYTPDNHHPHHHHHHHHDNAKINANEPILTAFYRTISTSAYDTSPTARNELHLWNMVSHPFPFLEKLPLDAIIMMPYSVVLLLWYGATNGPLLKFELQRRHTLYRRFIRTERGYIGLAGNGVRAGDRVVLCQGSKVPLVFRRVEEESEASGSTNREGTDKWRLVGDAYVHGIMAGEGFDEERCERMMLV